MTCRLIPDRPTAFCYGLFFGIVTMFLLPLLPDAGGDGHYKAVLTDTYRDGRHAGQLEMNKAWLDALPFLCRTYR